jgi:hypothetical protein
MEVANAGSRLFEMEANHLCITAPAGPPVSLHAPYAREGAARSPASLYAYHDKQLLWYPTTTVPLYQSRGWEPSHGCYRAT